MFERVRSPNEKNMFLWDTKTYVCDSRFRTKKKIFWKQKRTSPVSILTGIAPADSGFMWYTDMISIAFVVKIVAARITKENIVFFFSNFEEKHKKSKKDSNCNLKLPLRDVAIDS